MRAADHYDALIAITRTHEMPLAMDVILALADRGHPERARALADAASTELPGDLELFEVRLGLTIDLGDHPSAKEVLGQRSHWLSESIDGATTAARLYARLHADNLSREMWSRVIELEPEHFNAHYALGQSLASQAVQLHLAATGGNRSLLGSNLAELWREAESHLERAHRIDPARRAPLEALAELYTSKWAHVDPDDVPLGDQKAFDSDQVRRDTVQAMLDAR